MKQIFIIVNFVFYSLASNAQTKLVKYFNKLSTEQKHGITLTEKAGKVIAESGTGACTVIHDAANGYLKITDDGTGGGSLYFEMAIFKDAKGKEYLVTTAYTKSDVNEGLGNHFYNLPSMTEASSLWPDIGNIEDLLPNGVTKEDIAPYADSEYSYFTLPRKGTDLFMNIGFNKLDQKVDEADAAAKTLRKKLKPVKFKWNKTNASFEIAQ